MFSNRVEPATYNLSALMNVARGSTSLPHHKPLERITRPLLQPGSSLNCALFYALFWLWLRSFSTAGKFPFPKGLFSLSRGYVVDAVSQMDLVFVRTLLLLAFGLARESDTNDSVQSGVFSRGNVSERDEPEPVGGCHEHLHARVWVRPGEWSWPIPTCLSIAWVQLKINAQLCI